MKRHDRVNARMLAAAVLLAAGGAFGDEICDLSLNPDARDGHTPPDPTRYSVVCSSSRYEANPTSVMLPDGQTVLAFWDVQAAGPCGPAAVSTDAGRTWTRIDDRIPAAFAECHERPQAYRFTDPKTGKARIRVFATLGTATNWSWRGPAERPLAEAMPSVMSEDDGKTWKMLPPLGADFACASAFTGMVRLEDGSYLGVYARGVDPNGAGGNCCVMGSFSRDGGLTWEKPFEILAAKHESFALPTVFRMPDEKDLCLIASSGINDRPPVLSFSKDGGRTWTAPKSLPSGLRGSCHAVACAPDGRLVVAFRRGTGLSGWIGAPAALRNGKETDARSIKLCHSYGELFSTGRAGVHVGKGGEITVIASSQIDLSHPMPVVFAMHFTAEEVDRAIEDRTVARLHFAKWNPFRGTAFKPLVKARLHGPFAQEVVMTNKKERKIRPFDGTKAYVEKTAGKAFTEMSNANGTFVIDDYRHHKPGNAAIVAWTVSVPADCKARLRLVGSPKAQLLVGAKCVLPSVCATVFESRTAEVELKRGENEISAMVYVPQDRTSCEAGFGNLPMRIALGLDCADFKCVMPVDALEIKSEVDLDEVLLEE